MINPFRFQVEAAREISKRFTEYNKNPLMIDRNTPLPFFQVLAALTGSGKTVILANTAELLSANLGIAPVLLWVSKGKVVVEQTLKNLNGGRYTSLVSSYQVKPLLDLKKIDLENSDKGLILIATVAKFNQKDMHSGDRKVFQTGLDNAGEPLWNLLRDRFDAAGRRRPLIVIYDEGHNLSDQQTRLIFSLAPDAMIAASATAKYPHELSNVIGRLKRERHWTDQDFQVTIKSRNVVDAGLIKQFVKFDGFTTPMEQALDQMLTEFDAVSSAAESLGTGFRPKAIYVSNTNVLQSGKLKQEDDYMQPFSDRKARPIQIWRYLTEQKGIDPNEIAVYLNLKFDKKYPAPDNFHLFSQGEDDYHLFMQGNYRHIIFNLSLQEGWDDPECAFAYVDKDMGSPTQVAQVIGRVLRQPGAQHYSDTRLNTAHFYIRADEKGTFEEVLSEVKRKISKETPEVEIVLASSTGIGGGKVLEPVKKARQVPKAGINTSEAKKAIDSIMSRLPDYRNDVVNTVGTGSTVHILQRVGEDSDHEVEWVDVKHSNPVTARWVFLRELEYLEPRAAGLCDRANPKFDARLEYNSIAAEQIRSLAQEVARAYIQRSEIKVKSNDNPYEVQPIPLDPDTAENFKYALHSRYSGLNKLEKRFAEALDRKQRVWSRNPSSGYSLPLLSDKGRKFFPDFLVWVGKDVFAIDTKGDHLIENEADRKLMLLQNDGKGANLHLRLVTEGEWSPSFHKISGSKGMTVWVQRYGAPHPIHCETIEDAVMQCLSHT